MPSKEEFEKLLDYTLHNRTDLTKEPLINQFGFGALPAGFHLPTINPSCCYYYFGQHSYFWSSTDGYFPYHLIVGNHVEFVTRGDIDKKHGLSVRCLKNQN